MSLLHQLVIGSADFYEDTLLAWIYALALQDKGVKVSTKLSIGSRETYFAGLKDGSIDASEHDHERARELVEAISTEVGALAPRFPHDADYLAKLPGDLARWVDSGFARPDFLDSLLAFRPDECREDGIEHLVHRNQRQFLEVGRVGHRHILARAVDHRRIEIIEGALHDRGAQMVAD